MAAGTLTPTANRFDALLRSADDGASPASVEAGWIPARDARHVVLLSLLLTIVFALPVLRSPSTTIFGDEIVGRHYDPFTVMQQFAEGGRAGVARQPLTDVPGTLLARVVGPVAGYNLVVLASFPLTALATYALVIYLTRSRRAAVVAALMFTFAPVHVAHAAYHAHVAQMQWIPAYLLALIAAIDRPSPTRTVWLVCATLALGLSNAYGALIGAVVTPIAALAWWWTRARPERSLPNLVTPLMMVFAVALVAIAIATVEEPRLFDRGGALAASTGDLDRYGARWQAYLLPPVDHPLTGGLADAAWQRLQVGPGLLEQQLAPGLSLLLLALAGGILAFRQSDRRVTAAWLAMAVIGAWSTVVSLAPNATPVPWLAPATLVHDLLPMFRAYARFGIVTNLAVAVAAGIGVDRLLAYASASSQRRPVIVTRAIAAVLIAGAVFESTPLPWRARDVLPTSAHRWLTARQVPGPVLDCTPPSVADANLPWLMGTVAIAAMAPPMDGCDDPLLAQKMALLGYTHLIVRKDARRGHDEGAPSLSLLREAGDSRLFAVLPTARVATVSTDGFYEWERDQETAWRWLGSQGSWTIDNRSQAPQAVVLQLELESLKPATLSIDLGTVNVATLAVMPRVQAFTVGPLHLNNGQSGITFHVSEPAIRPDEAEHNGDRRLVTVKFRPWKWSVF